MRGKLTGRCTAAVPLTNNMSSSASLIGGGVAETVYGCPAAGNVTAAGHICDPAGVGFSCDTLLGDMCCKSMYFPLVGRCKLNLGSHH